MKLYKNLAILFIGALILAWVFIRLAEVSSGNMVYVYLIAIALLFTVYRILVYFNLFSSFKKDYNATPKELMDKNVEMERNYVGEIFLSIVAIVLFLKGYKEYNLTGLTQNSGVYFLGVIALIALIVRNIINKKSRIEKLGNLSVPEQNNLKKDNRVMIYVVIGLIILSFLYNFFK